MCQKMWMDFPQMAPLRAKPLICDQLGKDLTLRVSMIDTLGHLSLVIPKVPWIRTFLRPFWIVLDPKICSKDPRINSWPMLMHCCLVLNRCWLDIGSGEKNREAKFLQLLSLPHLTKFLKLCDTCLFFCPGFHLLRFLDTDTARKK